MIFDAKALARGWLSVAVASGTDKAAGGLYRTVAIEAHRDGYRLTATDKTTLLTSWVPNLPAGPLTEAPSIDEIPDEVVVASDPHGRGVGFLRHVYALASADDEDGDTPKQVEVAVRLSVEGDPDVEPATLAGFEATYVELELEGSETVRLLAHDDQFPDWRPIWTGFKAKRTSGIALAPDVAGRLAKLGKIQGGTTLRFSWSGPATAAHLELGNSEPHVEGFVMPCTWDFARNAPQADTSKAGDE